MGDFMDLFKVVLFSDDVIILDLLVEELLCDMLKLGCFDVKEDDYGCLISF